MEVSTFGATLLFSYAIPAHADDHEEAAPAEEAAAEEAEAGPVDDYLELFDAQRLCTSL